MNQPVIPLFLPRRVSEHSQLREWPSVPFRRRTLHAVRRRGGGSTDVMTETDAVVTSATPTVAPPVDPPAGTAPEQEQGTAAR